MIESFGGSDQTQDPDTVQIVSIDRRGKAGRNPPNHAVDNGDVFEDQSVPLF
jgi:hypothetical protein